MVKETCTFMRFVQDYKYLIWQEAWGCAQVKDSSCMTSDNCDDVFHKISIAVLFLQRFSEITGTMVNKCV